MTDGPNETRMLVPIQTYRYWTKHRALVPIQLTTELKAQRLGPIPPKQGSQEQPRCSRPSLSILVAVIAARPPPSLPRDLRGPKDPRRRSGQTSHDPACKLRPAASRACRPSRPRRSPPRRRRARGLRHSTRG